MGLAEWNAAVPRRFAPGARNLITDVPGVEVGHCTIADGAVNTGVTAILPARDDLFTRKMPAAAHVLNGFGKSAGLVQVQELGCIETPLLLTNTFGVGTVYTAVVRHMLALHPEIGDTTGTVNPVVMECNDGDINDIRALAVQDVHALAAIGSAGAHFAEGGQGAGAGMVCYGLKGGIGSASRLVPVGEGPSYTLGCLVLSNFGALGDFTPHGEPLGRALHERLAASGLLPGQKEAEKGSIIVVLATNAPLGSRQLLRVARRAGVGIARTGSFMAGGSGEIALAFSTANRIPHAEEEAERTLRQLHENRLDDFFAATAEVVEEAILSSLTHGKTTATRMGGRVLSLLDAIAMLG